MRPRWRRLPPTRRCGASRALSAKCLGQERPLQKPRPLCRASARKLPLRRSRGAWPRLTWMPSRSSPHGAYRADSSAHERASLPCSSSTPLDVANIFHKVSAAAVEFPASCGCAADPRAPPASARAGPVARMLLIARLSPPGRHASSQCVATPSAGAGPHFSRACPAFTAFAPMVGTTVAAARRSQAFAKLQHVSAAVLAVPRRRWSRR